jgi:hypothetical protein
VSAWRHCWLPQSAIQPVSGFVLAEMIPRSIRPTT